MVSVFLSSAAAAQTARPQELVSALSTPDPISRAAVTVKQHGDLASILNRARTIDGKMVDGYRVYIFLDNSQNAREKGQQAMSRFRGAFPDIPSEISYENPYWKVAVGNCLTKDEAMIVFGRVKGQFGSAFIRQENLPLKNFLRSSALSADETGETEVSE